MTGCRQQKPRFGLTKCPDLVDHYTTGQHRFMFEGVETGTGQRWYVPIMVAKGAADGKKVLLQAGVHGDELNGVRIVQKAMAQLIRPR
jgi:predicted deacylase